MGNVDALLYHAVRELLFNVVKHAEMKSATVTLDWMEDQVRIEVSDKGKGFNPANIETSSSGEFGLFWMRERLSLMDGHPLSTCEESVEFGGLCLNQEEPVRVTSMDIKEYCGERIDVVYVLESNEVLHELMEMDAYSGRCRTVIPISIGQVSDFCRTAFRADVGQF
jgi:hypothetical protein